MEKYIGTVTHYYNRLGVAVLSLVEGLRLGDTLHIIGHSTDFTQPVYSLEIAHQKVTAAGAGSDVALQVDERVRVGDEIYRVMAGEPIYF